jgi:hypothetical protein
MSTATRTSRRSNSHDDNLSYLKDAYSLQHTVSSPTAKQGSSKRLQTIESGIALNEKADNNDSSMSSSDKLLVDHHVSEEASSSPDSHQELFELQVSSSSQSSSPVLYNSYNTGGGGGERNSPPSTANNLPPLHPNAPPPPSLDLSTPKVNGSSSPKHIYNPSSTSYYSFDAGKHGFLSRVKTNGSTGSDSDDNGSIVFKYRPGEETPPAEYALPESILKVYGDHVVVLKRQSSDRSHDSSISSHAYEDDEGGSGVAVEGRQVKKVKKNNVAQSEKIMNPQQRQQQQQDLPPSLPRLPTDDDSPSSSPEIRMLPYHERKRLAEGQDSKQHRSQQQQQEQQRKKKNTSNKGGGTSGKRKVTSSLNNDKESSSLLSDRAVANGNSNHYGAMPVEKGKDDNDQQQEQQPKKSGWLGSIVSMVSGKDNNQSSIENESKSYLDRGRAFLKRTEEERMRLRETLKVEELNQLNIPYNRSFAGHRVKMSSLTYALDSIASCSDGEGDDDNDDESDEESGSSSFDEDESDTPITANNRVWKYGDKTVTSSKARKISLRDERMKRERLIEEEYEYRLRALRRENERLAMRFRLFILISVAFVFSGALAFAFVVCIRMLFG